MLPLTGHASRSRGNYAQSRSCVTDDTDVIVRRVSGALPDRFGNAGQTRDPIAAELSVRIQRSSNADHGRKQYRDRPLRGRQRRGNGGLSLEPLDDVELMSWQRNGTGTAFRPGSPT